MCWGECNQNSDKDITAEFHFNYWPQAVSKHNGKEAYLDIGVKLTNYENLTSLVFWFPKEFAKNFETAENFKDLGGIIKDNQTASLVFNEVLKTSSDAKTPKQTKISNSEDEELFIIYELSNDNVNTKEEYNGLTMYISLEQLIHQGIKASIYIRFRLMGDFLKNIEKKITVKNKLLQSAFTETSYVDFRFNDIRSCNSDLQEHLNNNKGKLHVSKVHFLLMARSDEEVTTSEPITARILEAEAWERYLGHKIDHVCVAYHWRFKSPEQNACIIYAHYKVLHCNGWTIAFYVLILFLLTIIMNLVSSTVYGHLHTFFPITFP